MRYTASCHCGAVTLEVQRKLRQLTQCNCSICRRYGALWAYVQRKALHVVDSEQRLRPYSWKDRRFAFFHCAICGCVTHYERTNRRDDGSDMAAVNVRNMDEPALVATLPIRLIDGAGSWQVLAVAPRPDLLCSPGLVTGQAPGAACR